MYKGILLCASDGITNPFWQTFGGPIATLTAVLISGCIGIILFIQGMKKERKMYQERRGIEKAEIIKETEIEFDFYSNYFLLLLNKVIEDSRKQKDFIIEYANNLIKNPTVQQYPTLLTQNMIKRFLDLDNEKILNVFYRKRVHEKEFISLFSNLDYLKEVLERFQYDLNNGAPDTVFKLSNDLLKIRDEILKTASDYLTCEKAKYNDNEHLKVPLNSEINDIFNIYYDDNDGIPNIQRDYDKLIIPIKKRLLTDEFRKVDITNDLLRLSKHSGDVIFSIKQLNTDFGNVLLKVSKNISDVCDSVEKIKTDLVKKVKMVDK